jgi:hypothetical protein
MALPIILTTHDCCYTLKNETDGKGRNPYGIYPTGRQSATAQQCRRLIFSQKGVLAITGFSGQVP